MKAIASGMLLLFLSVCTRAQQQKDFDTFCSNFVKGYTALHIPELQLSYSDNLQHIQPAYNIQKQEAFFKRTEKDLAIYKGRSLSKQQEIDYYLIEYEIKLNLERLALEKRWLDEKPSVIPINNIYSLPHGTEWYVYFLKRWIGADVNPDELYLNGLMEVENVQKHIEEIRIQTGLSKDSFYHYLNDSSFFLKDQAQVQQAFEHTKSVILKNISNVFNTHTIPNVEIQKGIDEKLVQTPGYYNNNIFYYNYLSAPYNKRQVDWLFIHEAIPGHHYQTSIAADAHPSAVQQLFWYPGFSEGWAAYTETLGKEIGVYQTPYDELGKWEWDLVRSVRVLLDIGLNYYGWSDDKALAFWKENIPNQDAIAMREINRMKRWPAQVITYKYGAEQILLWKQKQQQLQRDTFSIKTFHDRILAHGSLPFFLVKRNVFWRGS